MLNEKAFTEAAKTFHRLRGSAIACLRAAISVYRAEENFHGRSIYPHLVFSTADSDNGIDTALVISGFKDLSQLEAFVADIAHAQGK